MEGTEGTQGSHSCHTLEGPGLPAPLPAVPVAAHEASVCSERPWAWQPPAGSAGVSSSRRFPHLPGVRTPQWQG